jgi:hypothetical protein
VGWVTPSRVVAFCGWNTRLAPARKPRYRTPLTRVTTTTTTMADPMTIAISWWRCHRRMNTLASDLTAS